MRKISKALAIAATVIAISGTSLVAVAQTGGPGYGSPGYGPMGSMHGWGGNVMMGGGYGMMPGWGGGFADPASRLAALKAELAIRPEQTAAWDAYVKAETDAMTQLQAIRDSIDFDKLRAMPWKEYQAYRGQIHDRRVAVFKTIQTARDALVAVLDASQKARLLPSGPGYFGPGMMGCYGGSPMMGFGHGMMRWGPGGAR